jgi:hypothetical protein
VSSEPTSSTVFGRVSAAGVAALAGVLEQSKYLQTFDLTCGLMFFLSFERVSSRLSVFFVLLNVVGVALRCFICNASEPPSPSVTSFDCEALDTFLGALDKNTSVRDMSLRCEFLFLFLVWLTFNCYAGFVCSVGGGQGLGACALLC